MGLPDSLRALRLASSRIIRTDSALVELLEHNPAPTAGRIGLTDVLRMPRDSEPGDQTCLLDSEWGAAIPAVNRLVEASLRESRGISPEFVAALRGVITVMRNKRKYALGQQGSPVYAWAQVCYAMQRMLEYVVAVGAHTDVSGMDIIGLRRLLDDLDNEASQFAPVNAYLQLQTTIGAILELIPTQVESTP